MSESHPCFGEFNKELAKHNLKLSMGIQITQGLGLKSRLLVATEKIDKSKRKPGPSVMASFCPFCGIKLEGGAA